MNFYLLATHQDLSKILFCIIQIKAFVNSKQQIMVFEIYILMLFGSELYYQYLS